MTRRALLLSACVGWVLLGALGEAWPAARAPRGAGPRKIALLAGASGEGSPRENFFLEDLRRLRGTLLARGWDVRAVVGPKDRLLPGSTRATNENLLRGIRGALRDGGVGDEVLLLFHAHGREREAEWGQRSHSIVSEDRDAKGGDPGFDLDRVEPLLVEARGRGVRTALVDLSCYSGSSQALKGASCTVTLAAPRYVSLCSGREEERLFNARFFSLPTSGGPVSLEARFLDARRQDRDSINLPQISSRLTPALEGWDEFLLEADPLDVFEDLKELRAGARPFEAGKLLKAVDAGLSGVRSRRQTTRVRSEIADRLAKALKLRERLEAAIPSLARGFDEATLAVSLPTRGALKLSPGALLDLLEKSGAVSEMTIDGYSDARLGLLAEFRAAGAKIAAGLGRELDQFKARREGFEELKAELERAAGGLFEAERDLYDFLAPEAVAPNPCSEFTL